MLWGWVGCLWEAQQAQPWELRAAASCVEQLGTRGWRRERGRALPCRGGTGRLWRSGCSLCNWSSLILRETMFTDRVLIDLTS